MGLDEPGAEEMRLVEEVLAWADGGPLAVATDFDGTLAEISDDPSRVALIPASRAALESLARRARVLVLSGRELADLETRASLRGVALGGEHGGDRRLASGERILAPLDEASRDALEGFAREAESLLAGSGGWVERKRLSVAAHTRRVPPGAAPAIERALGLAAAARACESSLGAIAGKRVVELRAHGASKDVALAWFAGLEPRAGTVLALGDDATDEDLFRATNALGGYTIKVGEGWSLARRRLVDPRSVARFLEGLARALERPADRRGAASP